MACNCTLQEAYSNGPTIQESALNGPVAITRDSTLGNDEALVLEADPAVAGQQPVTLEIIGRGHLPGGEGGGATTTDLELTAIATSSGASSNATIAGRWEMSVVGLGIFFRQLLRDGYTTQINPNLTTAIDPLHSIGHLMEARYWDGAADQPWRATILHSMDQRVPGPASTLRFSFGTDNAGATGTESFRINSQDTTQVAAGASTITIAWNNAGVFASNQRVLVGAQGTGPGGGTTRALYLAS